ncbi:hypothetical protein E2C01_059161 [Portunus trituberculatus]|uniref:THAP-type domain-containing protein n=1 Tax=Portunus trituberculatus TaxID=210409 RepID=A0A5B7H6T9_PORTR|nr:hypothetical protein [Portunus trituberculatus]
MQRTIRNENKPVELIVKSGLVMGKRATFNYHPGYRPTKVDKASNKAGGSAAHRPSVFKFPQSHRPEIRYKRITELKCKITNWNPDHAGICVLHFISKDFLQETWRKTVCQWKILKTTAVPSVFYYYPE